MIQEYKAFPKFPGLLLLQKKENKRKEKSSQTNIYRIAVCIHSSARNEALKRLRYEKKIDDCFKNSRCSNM